MGLTWDCPRRTLGPISTQPRSIPAPAMLQKCLHAVLTLCCLWQGWGPSLFFPESVRGCWWPCYWRRLCPPHLSLRSTQHPAPQPQGSIWSVLILEFTMFLIQNNHICQHQLVGLKDFSQTNSVCAVRCLY